LARLDLLARFGVELEAAESRLNLTRILAPEAFWVKHVADSLALGLVLPEVLTGDLSVADVGSGAGFPALPLAWANPRLTVTAVEARRKKAEFIAGVTTRLGLVNCRVMARQVREVGRLPGHAGAYDHVLLRAVGSPARLIRACRQLLRPAAGAAIVFYMTPESLSGELALARREAAKFGLAAHASEAVELPCAGGSRQFLILRRP